jgi:hypothetical protein
MIRWKQIKFRTKGNIQTTQYPPCLRTVPIRRRLEFFHGSSIHIVPPRINLTPSGCIRALCGLTYTIKPILHNRKQIISRIEMHVVLAVVGAQVPATFSHSSSSRFFFRSPRSLFAPCCEISAPSTLAAC